MYRFKIMVSLSFLIASTIIFSSATACFSADSEAKLTAKEKESIAQLKPPATAEELTAYLKNRDEKGKEKTKLQNFIATRQYFRELKAKFPGRVDIATAPPPSADVSFYFTLNDEEDTLLNDLIWEKAKKKAGIR